MTKKAIGIDIGGTKIQIALVKEDGSIISNEIIPTLAHRGGQDIIDRIALQVNQIQKEYDHIEGIGIGTAGQVKHGKIISATSSFKDWININLAQEMQTRCNLDCKVINDVQSMLLGEQKFSNAGHNVLAVAIGTGVGGAIISDGKLIQGESQSAGEIGHMILYPQGRKCPCGNSGCLEAYLAGPAIEKRYFEISKEKLSAKEIFVEDNLNKQFVIYEAINNLIFALVSLINITSPQKVILSGGVCQSLEKYLDYIKENVKSQVLKANEDIEIEISNLLADAMILGAASQFL